MNDYEHFDPYGEYNQILIKKRENRKTASTLEGIVKQLTITSNNDKVILELETLIKQLRI